MRLAVCQGKTYNRESMSLFHAFVLGLIEGVTEFLPISSTFHLLVAMRLFGIEQTDFTNFLSIFIQGGAMIAVIILYGREWFQKPAQLKLLVASFLPTAVVGLALHSVITGVFFESFQLMVSVFFFVGVAFLLLEYWFARRRAQGNTPAEKTIDEMSYRLAVIVGLCQAAAILPGVSRAGAVMIAMLLLGFRRDEAAKYSFSLAVPTILAAAILDTYQSREMLRALGSQDVLALVVATFVACVSALIVMRWLIGYLRQRSFVLFGWYRIIAAPILWLLLFR